MQLRHVAQAAQPGSRNCVCVLRLNSRQKIKVDHYLHHPHLSRPKPVLLCRLHAVLGVSGMLEGYSLYVAVKSIRAGAAARKMGFVHYVKRYD